MAGKKKHSFGRGMLIYAVVYLIVAAVGLAVFWNFIDAYEHSRPKNTIDAYVAALTPADMCCKSLEADVQADLNLQSAEERSAIITASVSERVTYARKGSESTDARQVYVLRSGKQIIGEVVITAQEPDIYGFTEWEVSEDSFDFSYLMGQPLSVTVPENFTVSVNGHVLDESYITENGVAYPALEEFYEDYELPTMVTYTADAYLGQLEMTVADETGQPVAITQETDRNAFLDNCTEEEKEQVESFMGDFLESYVIFTGSSNQAASANYQRLRKNFLIPDSELAQRLYTALDGLAYAQSYGDKLETVEIHRVSRIDDTHYFCDATYCVSTYGRAGKVQTTNNMKVMLLVTDSGLRVEAMTRY